MLEEIRVKIFVESVFKFDVGGGPIDFVSEFNPSAEFQFDFIVRSQIDVDDILSVVADVEFLVSP